MSEAEEEKPYQRKLSLGQRFYKLLIAPSKAMEDIGLAPDYGGVGIVILLQVILSIMAIVLVFQKMQFVGPGASFIMSYVAGILVFAVAIAVALFMVRWLVKSLLVKVICDSGSSWSFSTAASVTGYAYLPQVIISVVSFFVSWALIPTVTIDTGNLTQAIVTMTQYEAQLSWLQLVFTLPMSIVAVVWKSYLGGLGAHFGTEKKCSRGAGIAAFFVLGVIGLVIDFVV
nr:YIP1 family protein [Candidatus Njordarchaeota archaeon]